MDKKPDSYNDAPLPIVPRDILQRYHVNEPGDTRFASCARLLQSIWRETRGLPPGQQRGRDGRARLLGSRLTPADARPGRNFLAPDIARTARHEAAYREIGALIDEQRLWENLLSSQPLTFNLFARCKTDPDFGSRVFKRLFPGVFRKVRHVAFEHSPGRGDPSLLGDHTAFDVFVSGVARDGAPAFVAIEVKYSETMRQPGRTSKQRYRELTRAHSLHLDPEAPTLLSEPLAQFTAEHLLAALTRERLGPKASGQFVAVAPAGNRDAWSAIDLYRSTLDCRSDQIPFIAVTLEDAISAIREAGDEDLAGRLRERYTDFTPVHRLIDEWEPFAEE